MDSRQECILREQKKVEAWTHPIGTRVRVTKDDGAIVETYTNSKAQLLGGHTAVVWLDGIAGCYLLDRVTVV